MKRYSIVLLSFCFGVFMVHADGQHENDKPVKGKTETTESTNKSECFSPDGNTKYFISDEIKGGFGGKDIYAAEKLSDGTWTKPYNLGKIINSSQDEDAPMLMSDGATLYFISKGHNTLGGYDIFYSTMSGDGLWSEIEHLGSPINTSEDDVYMILSPKKK